MSPLSLSLSLSPSASATVYLHLSVCLSVCLSLCHSVSLSLSLYLSVRPSLVGRCVCVSVCLSVCLPGFCLTVYLCVLCIMRLLPRGRDHGTLLRCCAYALRRGCAVTLPQTYAARRLRRNVATKRRRLGQVGGKRCVGMDVRRCSVKAQVSP